MVREFIVYACPTGPLAIRLDHYFQVTRQRVGANAAHSYPPHVSLTGFFHDGRGSVALYVTALDRALHRRWSSKPEHVVERMVLRLDHGFHRFDITAPWLQKLTGSFGRRAASPTRRDSIRRKDGLHLSLAYQYAPEQEATLATLARDLIDTRLPVGWDLCFFERSMSKGWVCYARWPLIET